MKEGFHGGCQLEGRGSDNNKSLQRSFKRCKVTLVSQSCHIGNGSALIFTSPFGLVFISPLLRLLPLPLPLPLSLSPSHNLSFTAPQLQNTGEGRGGEGRGGEERGGEERGGEERGGEGRGGDGTGGGRGGEGRAEQRVHR